MPHLARLALLACVLIAAAPAAAGTPSPADGGGASAHTPGVALFTSLFALGLDASTIGVSATELATVGPSAAQAGGDGDNLLIVDDGADCPNAEYATIQAAVTAADPGDRIKVCRGTYPEQIVIPAGKNGITLFSAGYLDAVIKAPPFMAEPGDIVYVNGARDVTIRHFTITGPLPDHLFCSVATRTGVKVEGGGSLLLSNNHITQIRATNPLLRGCQNGIAVRAGSRALNTTGNVELAHNLIDRYQKGGVVIDNAGSYGNIHHNEFVGIGPTPVIAQNGIQISRGAAADVDHHEVTANTYAVPAVAAGTGVLLFEPGAGAVTVGYNEVYLNDDGIALYDTDDSLIEHNYSHDQRAYDGVFADSDSTGNRIAYNRLERNFEHDCHDDTVGPPPSLSLNFWVKNHGLTENKPGLCKRTG